MDAKSERGPAVAKIVSLVVLVVILLLVGWLFVHVMAGFLLPLFLALLLVIIFRPLLRWFQSRCGRHDRIAAMLTTAAILLLVLIPLSLLVVEAAYDAQLLYRTATDGRATTDASGPTPDVAALVHWLTDKAVAVGGHLGMELNRKDLETRLAQNMRQFLAPLALRTTQFLGQAIFGLFVMILATYYFFADGSVMVEAILRLSPIEGGRTRELIDQFDGVTRAVVVATLSSAFLQGLFVGAGYWIAGAGSIFLLTALSMLFTLVPFVGAAIVWAPVCLWLFVVEGRTTAAVLLAIYCVVIVSSIDNLVKPLVLRGRSNLHPLLALLSVLGGVEALGAIGILVGPMIVAFLQTLVNMVHAELTGFCRTQDTVA